MHLLKGRGVPPLWGLVIWFRGSLFVAISLRLLLMVIFQMMRLRTTWIILRLLRTRPSRGISLFLTVLLCH